LRNKIFAKQDACDRRPGGQTARETAESRITGGVAAPVTNVLR
jgi:hypothetical protein